MSALVIAEHDNASLKSATLNTISAASELGEVDVLLAGWQCTSLAAVLVKVQGVRKVLLIDEEQYEHGLADDFAALIASISEGYCHFLAPATTFGKNIMPRLAALLDVAQISDVIKIESDDTFVRPIYAGNALATVQSIDRQKVLTVRASVFEAAAMNVEGASADIETIKGQTSLSLASFVKHELTKSKRPEITAADIVISGGRGLGSADSFKLIEDIADKLGAAIGASRAAVDAGFVPNDYQVGQTGKIVAPKLYIAVGISGAIQHIAGMKGSKVIVAINKDEEAPIFSIADYGLVGDLFAVLPELSSALDEG